MALGSRMVDGGFMKFTIRIVSWYWTMFYFFAVFGLFFKNEISG
jgi:hypothetical protein